MYDLAVRSIFFYILSFLVHLAGIRKKQQLFDCWNKICHFCFLSASCFLLRVIFICLLFAIFFFAATLDSRMFVPLLFRFSANLDCILCIFRLSFIQKAIYGWCRRSFYGQMIRILKLIFVFWSSMNETRKKTTKNTFFVCFFLSAVCCFSFIRSLMRRME